MTRFLSPWPPEFCGPVSSGGALARWVRWSGGVCGLAIAGVAWIAFSVVPAPALELAVARVVAEGLRESGSALVREVWIAVSVSRYGGDAAGKPPELPVGGHVAEVERADRVPGVARPPTAICLSSELVHREPSSRAPQEGPTGDRSDAARIYLVQDRERILTVQLGRRGDGELERRWQPIAPPNVSME